MDDDSREMWAELESVEIVEYLKGIIPPLADVYDLEFTADLHNYTLEIVSEICVAMAELMVKHNG